MPLILLIASVSHAGNWFVRTEESVASAGNGRSYESAWNGFSRIDWRQITPGDTLYVCDTHVGGGLNIGASGTQGKRITIRGDWPGHPGTILGASIVLTGGWKLHDAKHNVWTRTFNTPMSYSDYHAFARPAQSDPVQGIIRLHNAGEPKWAGTGVRDDFARWKEGTYYRDEAAGQLYFKPVSGSANEYIYYAGYEPACLTANGKSYFDIRNLTVMMGGGSKNRGIIMLKSADHATIDRVSVRWGSQGIIFGPFWLRRHQKGAVSENIVVSNSTVHDCRCGIYPYGGVKKCQITGNHVYDIGQYGYYLPWRKGRWYGDIHGIAIQGGGNGLIIERNHVHHVGGEGIFPYGDNNPEGVNIREMRNFSIRYNLVHDMKYIGSPAKPVHHSSGKESGLYYNQNNDFPSEGMSGNVMAYNIIYNVNQGIRMKNNANRKTGRPTWEVYNNVIDNADVGYCWYSSGNAGGSQPHNKSGVIFKNNIIINARSTFIQIGRATIKEYDQLIFDNNIYSPALAEGFAWPEGKGDFTVWRSWTAGTTRDANSLVVDPGFKNPAEHDYHLQEDSPAIDAGTYVGETRDWDGRPVPQGKGLELGAFEVSDS